MDEHLIFLSYASPDRARVADYFTHLASRGFNVWWDKRRLKGGQNWDLEIKIALQKAVIIVVFLSSNSVDGRGYAQREIKIALDQSRERLLDDVYIVPVLLDDGLTIPRELTGIQAILASDSESKSELSESIQMQLERLGVEASRSQAESNIRWSVTRYRDSWEGLPGYDTTYQLLNLSSEQYPQISEVTDIVRGWLLSRVLNERTAKFSQIPDIMNFGKDRFFRQNLWNASCGDPKIKERALSIVYNIWWFGAGAAHPNQFFQTFSFTLDPITYIEGAQELFANEEVAFKQIQDECRRKLLEQRFEGMTNDDSTLNLTQDYVHSGTEKWSDFENFAFGEEGIDFLFSTYQVAPYAFGPQVASVSYEILAPLMHHHLACALGIEYLGREPTWTAPAADAAAAASAMRERGEVG
ncbi:MAG: TIR domain-containing protein [Phenylobacterium sp.]|uniref:TIR domain-containing protein n=1 Tax=Phenylobacterium sp. TaxID=1871053 RepID=UPI001A5B8BED|nr:TIR domain-containing protein [Phenylobacterium sp.]MBL8554214.1 TIR domain-containing protein [Phenylobacterium sp.]